MFAVDGSADVCRLASTMGVPLASRRLRDFVHKLVPADIPLPHPLCRRGRCPRARLGSRGSRGVPQSVGRVEGDGAGFDEVVAVAGVRDRAVRDGGRLWGRGSR